MDCCTCIRNRSSFHLLQVVFSNLKKMIQASIKVSLIAVNNIIVKKVSLTVSLIAVNVINYRILLLQ
jgi:hypothetical protein